MIIHTCARCGKRIHFNTGNFRIDNEVVLLPELGVNKFAPKSPRYYHEDCSLVAEE